MAIRVPNFPDLVVLRGREEQSAARRRDQYQTTARRLGQSPTGEHTRNVQRFVSLAIRIGHLATLASAAGIGLVGASFKGASIFRGLMTVEKASRAAVALSPLGLVGKLGKNDFEAQRFQDPLDGQEFLQPGSFEGAELSPLKVAYAASRVSAEYLGIGLSLAPIVGFLSSLVTESPLGVPLEAAYGVIDPLTNAALDVLRESPLGFLTGQVLSLEDHLHFTLGTQLAWEIARPWLDHSPLAPTLSHFLDRPIPLKRFPIALDPVGQDALQVDPQETPRWPLAGEPTHYVWREHAELVRRAAEQTVAELHAEYREQEIGDLLFGSIRHIARQTVQALSGNPNATRTGLSPLSRLLAGYIERPFIAPEETTPELMAKLFRLGLSVQTATGRALPDRVDLVDALRRAQREAPTS